MPLEPIPDLESFLAAPLDEVARQTPASLIYAAGGTRRQAALAGFPPTNLAFVDWSQAQMHTCFELLFRHGVQHLLTGAIIPRQLAESGTYGSKLLDWVAYGLAGEPARASYARHGWRVRLHGADNIPQLRPVAEQLLADTPPHWQHTLWWLVQGSDDAEWLAVFAAARQPAVQTRADAIRAVYGEDVPTAGIYLGFGKPLVMTDTLPLLMTASTQCYWTQQPGYALDEPGLRRILYDYAYLRRTWQHDKTERYAVLESQRQLWEQPRTLGLGRRVGPFWYPHDEY